MLTRIFFAIIFFEKIARTSGDYLEFCTTLSQCMVDAENYYQQYLSLINQMNFTTTTNETETEICLSELKDIQKEFEFLDSQKRQYVARCVNETAADNVVVDLTQIIKLTKALTAYVKSLENRISPLLNVTLAICKCEQLIQIGTYWSLFTKTRDQCDTFRDGCSQWVVCNEQYQRDQKETFLRLTDLKEKTKNKISECFPPKPRINSTETIVL